MFLTEKHRLVPFFPSCNNPIPLSDPFDTAVSSRLISLLTTSPTENHFYWLTHACELLSLTISDATSLLLHQRNSSLSYDQSSFLDSTTLYLLDSCNSVSAFSERLLSRLLFVRFALKSKKMTVSEKKPLPQLRTVRLMKKPPHGKTDPVQNAICAVESISALVIGAIWVTLSGKGDEDLHGLKVNSEIFAWGKDFNKVLDVMSKRTGDGSVDDELEKMEATIGKATAEMDFNGEMEKKRFDEMERTCEEMRERLEKLNGSVNAVFQAALCARNAAVQNLLGGAHKKCQLKKGDYDGGLEGGVIF